MSIFEFGLYCCFAIVCALLIVIGLVMLNNSRINSIRKDHDLN